ncbi:MULTISPECIES: hypothetical protein [unclassified Nocardioides]|uniref:hypothetical protein n=1 Tax=unclassified Nocardioides TaxID=2615069 RepID=UPI0030155461
MTGARPRSRLRRLVLVAGIGGALVLLVLAFRGYLQLALESERCDATPPGYENQRAVSKELKPLWYECVMDPGNGEEQYVVHGPFQSVRGD